MAQWSPEHDRVVFLLGRTQFFGGKSCPVNFARIPDWCCFMLACLGAIASSHCVDDLLSVDRFSTIAEAWLLWRCFAILCGWDVPDKKSPIPDQAHRVLGAMSDLSATPSGFPQITVTVDRANQLRWILEDVWARQGLSCGLAGQIWGKLGFAATQLFGRFGRAKLRPFNQRQHEPHRFRLNPSFWQRSSGGWTS